MTSLFERFEELEIGLFHLNQIVDIGHICHIFIYLYHAQLISCNIDLLDGLLCTNI